MRHSFRRRYASRIRPHFQRGIVSVATSTLLLICIPAINAKTTSDIIGSVSASPDQSGKKITCIVSDNMGEVIGANVSVKGTTNGNITDADGKAVLTNVPEGATIVVSYIGYVTQEIKVGAQTTISVMLLEDTQKLDEVVVIGYGTTKRKDYTGSVSSVKLENSPIALAGNTNALESMKGNVSGLDVGATNTAGGEPSMQMRGQKSISGSNDPLLVVDGVIFMGNINDINPNDIASVDVLKDATSAAAYGSRSANGVIIITTKKGHSDKPVITFNAQGSMQIWTTKPDMMEGETYLQASKDRNQSTDISWMTPQEQANYNADITTDWLDYISRTGWKQEYQVGVSGASDKVNYYLSGSYSDNDGVIKGDNYNRTAILGKVSTDITDWLKISVDGAYTRQDYSGVEANMQTAYYLSPYGQATRANNTEIEKYPMTQSDGLMNPLWQTDESRRSNIDKRDNFRLNTSALVKCPWIDGLSYRFNYAGNLTKREQSDFYYETYYVKEGAYDDNTRYSAEAYQNLLSKANGTLYNYTTSSWVIDNILNYNKIFGKHNIDITAVATRDSKTYKYVKTTGTDYAANGNTTLGINGMHLATNQKVILYSTDAVPYKRTNIGYMGRAMYSFDDRYFLTGSFRRDGASVFGANKKWGNYAAVGGAWKITNEAFYPETWKNTLTDLKLKLSWGKNGNQGLDPYGTLSTVSNGSASGIRYEFNGSTINYGLIASALGNADLGWESTEAWNMGFESSWFNGRITVDLDYYVSQTKDQIFTRNIPVMTGFKTIKSSLGQVNNRGIEVTVRTINMQNKDFEWSSGLTFWLNRNKLVHLYGEDLDGDGKEDDDVANSYFINKPLGAIYGYKQDGIVQTGDTEYMTAYGVNAGTPKYVDLDGDGKITSDDRTILGYKTPNFRLNFNNTLNYKNFELYFLLAGTFGGSNYYMAENAEAYMINGHGYPSGNVINIPYWTESNPSNKYPSAQFNGDGRFKGLQNRGFVRLQDVTLSYNFRQTWMKNIGINTMKLFMSGKNLFTITNWVGDDPETGAKVLSSTLPVCASYSLGVNVSF